MPKLMNTVRYILLFLCLCGTRTISAQEGSLSECSITLDFQKENQAIDGFGVAQAGWADAVFVFPKRNELLEALFGEDGLRVNILRGEIFPHYSIDSLRSDFAIKADTSMNAAIRSDRNDLLRRSQFWLTSQVRWKYPRTRFIFSAWSPPAWMKIGGHATPDHPASNGRLHPKHYRSYADYLADFYGAFHSAGIDIYGISPSNEPGFAAPWNSCLWSAEEMGDFIHNHLLPVFKKRKIPSKIILGENPAWSTVFERLKMISSADFVNTILSEYPDLEKERLIAAGHGYVLPDTIPLPEELRRTPILPILEAEKKDIPMWVTEISDITPLDLSMEDGLYWANVFHQYLTNAHVSAIVWWAGAQPTTNNESLIVLNQSSGEFVLSKRYDTFGNYTRYISPGSRCIENKSEGLPQEISVSSFKKGKQYTMVVVNPTDSGITCLLKLKGAQACQELRSYTTTAGERWKEGQISCTDNRYRLQLPPKSVVTYTGQIR